MIWFLTYSFENKIRPIMIGSLRNKVDIHEYQAKEILEEHGIKIPTGAICYSPEQAVYRAHEIGGKLG